MSQKEVQPVSGVDSARLLLNSPLAQGGSHYGLKEETRRLGDTPPLSDIHQHSVWFRGASRKGTAAAIASCATLKSPHRTKRTPKSSVVPRSAADMLGQSVIKQLLNKFFLKLSTTKAEEPDSPKPSKGAALQRQRVDSGAPAKVRTQPMDRYRIPSQLNEDTQNRSGVQSCGPQKMKQPQQQQSRQQPKTRKQEADYPKGQCGARIRPLKESEEPVRADGTHDDVIAEFKRAILDQKHQRERGFNEQQKIARDVRRHERQNDYELYGSSIPADSRSRQFIHAVKELSRYLVVYAFGCFFEFASFQYL